MWYQTEMMMKDRQETIRRDADEARMNRPDAGRQRAPGKHGRLGLRSRS